MFFFGLRGDRYKQAMNDDDTRCCEMCKMLSGCVQLRQSDQNLCESCHSYEKSLTRSQENIIEGETQSEMASATMVPHSLSEDDCAARAIEADEVNHHEDSHHEIDDNVVCDMRTHLIQWSFARNVKKR